VAAVTMAANEAWENAIEHAHAFAPVPISVSFERRDDEVYITTHDVGGGRVGQPDPDRGRGIDLMRALVDEASFSFGGRYGGSVLLRRHLGRPLERTDAGRTAGAAPAEHAG
jgi:anti-sigma regulatory factor (Ser/Thr protein kinase)